jgi:dienelactone hydrolase
MTRPTRLALAALVITAATSTARADDLADALQKLDLRVVPADSDRAKELPRMLGRDARARIDAANRRETEAWHKVTTREQWEAFRDQRVEALGRSLGRFPDPPKDLHLRVTRTIDGDGYQIKNVVFESRPGVFVTANLYAPAKPPKAMPGILIVHSHHNPKTQGELQDMGMTFARGGPSPDMDKDMGMTWARQGCLVLVMDQLGHGERRQHPFVTAKDYEGKFQPGRQDYYFRFNTGMQLSLIGDGLIGWMVWDIRRGIDLLLDQPGTDKEKITVLGSVAAGGEPAAVTAALDRRVAAVAAFNFGGPQPESRYPLPADAEDTFDYAGGGSWESTRNLRLSARDGFLPWVIVGAAAPRGLVYAHEFAWDRDHDPVWKRLQTIYGFYGAKDNLAFTMGKGSVKGQAGPENSHANNIGPLHRQGIYPALKTWFDMPIPEKEYQERHKGEELLCLTPDVLKEIKPRPLYEVAGEIGDERASAARKPLADLNPEARRKRLREEWAKLLGNVSPAAPEAKDFAGVRAGTATAWPALIDAPGVKVPVVVLTPTGAKGPLPVVVCVCQEGKQAFLKQRAGAVAALLQGGVAVCVPDLRGTGETRPGDGRGRQSAATAISSTELMLGQTLLGERLRDLRSVLTYLRDWSGHEHKLDARRVALWGDSLAPVNAPDRDLKVPLDADKQPDLAEPLGGLLALFGALFEDDVKAVYVRGGLDGYRSVLQSQFVYVPHDIIVPGALTAGDLCDVAAALSPRPLRLEAMVDGLNRRVKLNALEKTYGPARIAYGDGQPQSALRLAEEPSSPADAARWLLDNLSR